MEKPAQWALVGAAWFLALSVAVLGCLAWHRFGAMPAVPAGGPPQGSEAELAEGATAICPVTGHKLVVSAATPRVIYQSRVYYFDDKPDAAGILPKRRFLSDPEAILHPGLAPTLEQQTLAANAALTATVAHSVPTLAPTPLPTAVPTAVPTPIPTLAPTPRPSAAAKP